MIVIAVAVMVFGPMAAATVWSSGSYGFDSGSVTWETMGVGSEAVTQLGGTAGQANTLEQTAEMVQLGSNGNQASTQEQNVATVQLGSSGGQASTQASASGILQLSGYYENMGSYTNVYYPSIMLGGTFGGSGGGGCSSCG